MHLLSEGEEDIEKILRDLTEKEKQKTGSMPMKLLSVSYLYTLQSVFLYFLSQTISRHRHGGC